MEELPFIERVKRPYSLLLDPDTGRAAAYTSNHRPVVELASKKLLDYALSHVARRAPFDRERHAAGLPRWRPLPAWATDDVLDRLVVVWMERPDGDDDAGWRAIPRK